MKNKNTFLFSLIILIVIAALTACSTTTRQNAKVGLPAFQLLETLPASSVVDNSASSPTAAPKGETGAPSTQAEPVCGGPESLVILALGVDENAQTDVLRLVRADFIQQKITVLSIPRDLWVPISGLAAHDIKEGRINSIYGFGEVYTGHGSGVERLAENINQNFNVEVDHHGLVYLVNFAKLIDKIGGVDLELEQPVVGGTAGKPFFPAGINHLTGQQALEFSRIRELDSDDYRIDRQTMVVKAALKKLRDNSSTVELVKLGSQFMLEGSVSTDIPLNTLYSLACLGKDIDGDNISFISMPPSLYTSTITSLGGNIRIPNPGAAEFIKAVMDGEDVLLEN